MKSAILAVIFAACIVASSAMNCVVKNGAGDEVDLSKIPTTTKVIDQMYQGKPSSYTWVFSPCQAVSQTPSGKGACGGPGYVSEYNTGCETYWNQEISSFVWNEALKSFQATYKDTVKSWMATVNIACGTTDELQSNGNVIVSDTLHFTFNLNSKIACGGGGGHNGGGDNGNGNGGGDDKKKKSDDGSIGGIVFVCIFFVGGFLYLAIFMALNYFKDGKRGKEVLPHPEFWASIPGLIKDGAIFTKDKTVEGVNKIRGRGGESGGAAEAKYESV